MSVEPNTSGSVKVSSRNRRASRIAKKTFVAASELARAAPVCLIAVKRSVRAMVMRKIPAKAMLSRGKPQAGQGCVKSPFTAEITANKTWPTRAVAAVPKTGSIPLMARRPKISRSANRMAPPRAKKTATCIILENRRGDGYIRGDPSMNQGLNGFSQRLEMRWSVHL